MIKQRILTALVVLLALSMSITVWAETSQELSSDLYSFQVRIDGVVYAFPCDFDQLTQAGWQFKGDETETLKSNYYDLVYFTKEGYTDMMAYGFNCYSSARPINTCYIAGFELSTNSYDKVDTVTCEMPGGIALNVSTIDDVINAYGDPSDRYDSETRTSLSYRYDIYRELTFASNDESNVVRSIKIQNLIEPEGFVDELGDTHSAPEIVSLYREPEKLGDYPLAYTIELAGDLYQIPAPVSAFIDNGFSIMPDKTDAIAEGSGSGWVTLLKNNQQLRTLATNYTENALDIEHCFVTSVDVSTMGCNLPAAIPMGIEIGTAHDELRQILDGVEHLVEDSSSYIIYQIANNERATNAVSIYVNKESDSVYHIEVENSVKREAIEQWLQKAASFIDLPKPAFRAFEPASPVSMVAAMSDDLYSFQVLINDRLYQLPVDYAVIEGDGWVNEEAQDVTIRANGYDSLVFKFGSAMAPKTQAYMYAVNLSDSEKAFSDCGIAGFQISEYDDKRDPKTRFVLPGGIELNVSTKADVLAAYGDPTDDYQGKRLTYEKDRYQDIELSFDDDVLTGIRMRNYM